MTLELVNGVVFARTSEKDFNEIISSANSKKENFIKVEIQRNGHHGEFIGYKSINININNIVAYYE